MAPEKQKTVVITGCSQGGIGDALALEFHRRGLRVFATARNLKKIQSLQDLGIECLSLDVIDHDSVRAAAAEVSRRTGGTLDLLVNNSGVGYQMPLLDADLDEARRVFEVNVWGTLAMTQIFAPLLAAAVVADDKGDQMTSNGKDTNGNKTDVGRGFKKSRRRARVVNIGSVTSRMHVPWQGVYNASKAAMGMMNDTLRFEVEPLGIDVLHIVTGGIQTEFYGNTAGAVLPGPGSDGKGKRSLYEPGRAVLEADLAGRGAKSHQTMTSEKYAQIVVRNALSRRPTKVMWLGGTSLLSHVASRFGWATINDFTMRNVMFPMMRPLRKKLDEARAERRAGRVEV